MGQKFTHAPISLKIVWNCLSWHKNSEDALFHASPVLRFYYYYYYLFRPLQDYSLPFNFSVDIILTPILKFARWIPDSWLSISVGLVYNTFTTKNYICKGPFVFFDRGSQIYKQSTSLDFWPHLYFGNKNVWPPPPTTTTTDTYPSPSQTG